MPTNPSTVLYRASLARRQHLGCTLQLGRGYATLPHCSCSVQHGARQGARLTIRAVPEPEMLQST